MAVNVEIQHFDNFEIKSKIKFWNDYSQKASVIKEKPEYFQQGKVKQKVAIIENLGKQFDTTCTKTHNTQKHKINMSNIINYLLDIQTHLRYDLNYIKWPSVIIGRTTQTSITYANVIIKLDEPDCHD